MNHRKSTHQEDPMACKNQPQDGNPRPCSATPGVSSSSPSARALLSDAAFTGVMHTVLDNNPGMDPSRASRIVVEALKFVHAASLFPLVRISPTEEVDEGWHALILHTHLYATLCSRLGRTVHHFPERPEAARPDPDILTRTMALIEQAGYNVDAELWTGRQESLVGVVRHTPMPGGCGPINPGNCASHGGDDDE
ncbi:glycine-rich domain-containing protein [Streptomyces sp. NPDC058671]|uniref:glycine-rich domain-containing protein n=1 Tax=Streptomyces sp. NPDC058671 TaxID=3346590 RepID=UPI00365BF2BA